MAMTDFSGQTVFVTGGASGIGRGIVEAFVSKGARVAFTYATSADAAEAMVAEAPAGTLKAIQADCTREDSVIEAVRKANDAFGPISVGVANAGGLLRRCIVTEFPLQLWNDVLAVNLTSTFLTAKALLPQMIERGSGALVLMSSLAAHDGGGMGASAYAASKGGVMTFTKALAKEVGGQGIRVNGVAPGLIGTQFHDQFSTEDGRRQTVARTPLGREGTPADVASAVLYLASDEASFLTGETIEINGGLAMF